jgi:hypothetical protein
MDFPIPHNICPLVYGDIVRLLDMARQQGFPATEFPGATYLCHGLDRQLTPSSSTAPAPITPRRKNKVETQKAQKAATSAKVRRARNDTRQRLAAHAHAFAHRRILDHEVKDSDSDSDSDVPLSQRFSSNAPSILTPLTTPTPDHPTSLTVSTPPTHPHTLVYECDNEGESEAPMSDDEAGFDASLLDNEQESAPGPELTSGLDRQITWEITELPRGPPKETSRFITRLGLLQNDEAQSLLKRVIPLLQSPSLPTTTAVEPSSLAEVASLCLSSESNIAEQSFLHMRSLLQFTLWIE